MKKNVLIFISILFLSILILYFQNKNSKNKAINNDNRFEKSHFYKNYYSSNDLVLVNVWATWCKYCLIEFPALEKIKPSKNLKFVSLSIDNDTLRLKKFLNKNKLVYLRDITLQNINFRDTICRRIELTGYTNAVDVMLNRKTIPYTVLIKNKKILYKAIDDLDVDSLNTIIQQNQ